MRLKVDIDNDLNIFLPQSLFQYTDPIWTDCTTLLKGGFTVHILHRSTQ